MKNTSVYRKGLDSLMRVFFLIVSAVINPSGEYGTVEMAALGATLGALLLICLVVIGVLAHRMQNGKADWKKIYEANIFRSSVSLRFRCG